MKLLIHADYIVYKSCAAAEEEIDWGNETIYEIVKLVKNSLDDSSHPKLRFAAYHIIG